MKFFDTSSPEKAYKSSVRPLGILFFLQGLMALNVYFSFPKEHLQEAPVPFVPDPFKHYFFLLLALMILVIGIGLFFRSKPVWYLFLGYMIVGTVWLILGIAFDYFQRNGVQKEILVPIITVLSTLLALALYKMTKPAFEKAS